MGVDEQETVEVVRREDDRYRPTVLARIRRDARAVDQTRRRARGLHRRLARGEELRTLADVIDAYEAKRWPSGKVAGGKG
jgi:hypothetical protein